MFFQYGETEINALKQKDVKMKEAIERIGYIERAIDSDLFSSVVHHIIGQQISMKAQATIWQRMQNDLKQINAKSICDASIEQLQSYGISFRKANYIADFADKVKTNAFDLEAVKKMSDEDAIAALSSLKGIGEWTAEMILLFCLQRQNIFSYKDLGIQKGLCILYHHRKITKPLFEKYRRRFSPYGSIASFYLWAIAASQKNDK